MLFETEKKYVRYSLLKYINRSGLNLFSQQTANVNKFHPQNRRQKRRKETTLKSSCGWRMEQCILLSNTYSPSVVTGHSDGLKVEISFFPRIGIHHVTKSADVEKKHETRDARAANGLPSRVTHGSRSSRYGTPFVSSSKKRGQWK